MPCSRFHRVADLGLFYPDPEQNIDSRGMFRPYPDPNPTKFCKPG